jgi:hypothetical protein
VNILVWISVLFSPLFKLGVVVRADQLWCPLLFALCLNAHRRTYARNPGSRTIVVYVLAIAVASLAGVAVTNNRAVWSAVKWPVLLMTNVLAAYCIAWSSKLDRQGIYRQNLKILQWLLFCVGVVGILQVAEHRDMLRTTHVTNALAAYYPYWGELTDAAYDKSFGRQLKVGGAGRLTSVVDGHPILAGDLLAFCLLITMPLARGRRGWLLHAVPCIALVLTLSRGSIVPWLIGVMVYCYLVMRYSRAASMERKNAVTRLIGLAAILGSIILTPLGEGVLWRVASSFDTLQGVGVRDGRTEQVWPDVMAALRESTTTELVFGLGDSYDGPTDSQYLLTLVSDGLIGLLALLAVHIALLCYAHRYAMKCIRGNLSPELAFAFMAAVSALMAMYIVHPACQNRRLLTVVVVAAVLLFQAVPDFRRTSKPKDARCEVQGRPSFQPALVR